MATPLHAAKRSPSARAVIDLDAVSKHYTVDGQRIPVLRDVSLRVNEGEFLAIVGPSGNGKSTLLNLITGIDKPSSGAVNVTDQRIDRLSEDKLAAWRGKHLGIVFQFFQMLPGLSLLQNVMLPMALAGTIPGSQRRERARALLADVGLSEQANKLPSMVSGGQQQRAAIARALANDPSVLVADEPTGNLDARTSEAVFALFLKLADGRRTLVMVTHNHDMAQRAGRCIAVVNGQIVSDTSASAVDASAARAAPIQA
jgi:putative ABC transport system ATP-binding protein